MRRRGNVALQAHPPLTLVINAMSRISGGFHVKSAEFALFMMSCFYLSSLSSMLRTYTGNGKTDSQHVCQMGSQSHTDQCFFYLYLYLPWKHRLTSSKSLWVCTLKPATPADRFQVFKNCLRPRFPPSPWQTGLKQRASIESNPVLFFAFLGYGYGHHYDLKLVKIPLDFIKATGFEQRALIENGPKKNTSMIVLIINSQSFKLLEDS